MYLSLPDILLLGVIAQFLFLAVVAAVVPNRRRGVGITLALLLTGIAGTQLEVFFHTTGLAMSYPRIAYWGTVVGMLQPGAIYLYARSVMYRDRPLQLRDLIHGVPPLLAAGIFWFGYYRLPSAAQLAILTDSQYPGVMNSVLLAILLHGIMLAYLGATIHSLSRFGVALRNLFSDLHNKQLTWLRNLLGAYAAAWGLSLAYCLLAHVFRVSTSHGGLTVATVLVSALILLPMTLLALRQPRLFAGIRSDTLPPPQADRSLSDATDSQTADQIRLLEALMANERPHLHSNLTVSQLARRLSMPPRDLSRLFSQEMETSFYEFINGYRIEEACLRLADPAEQGTVLDIMYDSGFNSKSVFNSLFRKTIGMTPSQYRRTCREQPPSPSSR